mmetsp:Transcript_29988/g.75626  ORF Transcript_29988/g.75626 Transcript_29988/m.75626 type:complete len:609 (-) Transcript_29988:179-2005(-)
MMGNPGCREELLKRVVKRILAGDFAGADKILDSIAHTIKSTSGKAFYHSLIHACAKAGSPKAAEWCAERLVRRGIKPNAVTYNSVIDACARVGNVSLATRWLDMMKMQSLTPNGITYNTMIKACAQARDSSGAEWWMQKMQDDGFLPCIVTFSTVIDALAKTGKVEQAEKWFHHMEEIGVEPDAVLYNCIINACARAGNPSKAERWLTQMRAQGLQADERTYNSVINACAKVGAVSRAEKWFRKLEQDGCRADKITFGSLINACARAGNIEKAEFWIDEMQHRGTEPNLICLNTVLNACAQRGNHEKTLKWFKRLSEVGEPNRVSYNSMVEALVKSGLYAEVETWLKRMLVRGMPVDEITYAILLRGGSKNQEDTDLDAALLWTISTIVKVHARVGEIQAIPLWLGQLADSGLQPPVGLLEECLSSVAALGDPSLSARFNSIVPLFTAPPGPRPVGKLQASSPPSAVRRAFVGRRSSGAGGGNTADASDVPDVGLAWSQKRGKVVETPVATPPGLMHSTLSSVPEIAEVPKKFTAPTPALEAREAEGCATSYTAPSPPETCSVPMPFSAVRPLAADLMPQHPSNIDTLAFVNWTAARSDCVHFERMSF